MDVLTLSLAAKKAFEAMGVKIEPMKTVLTGEVSEEGIARGEVIALEVGREYGFFAVDKTGKYEDVLIGKAVAQEMGGIAWVGNMALFMPDAPDTGEDFCVFPYPEEGCSMVVVTGLGQGAIFALKALETIHPIDPKFLPGGGGGMPKIEVHVASLDEACDFTLTPEQVATVKSAATSGMPLVFSVVDDGAGVKVNVFANLTYVQQSDYYAAKGTYEGSTVAIEGVGDTVTGRWEFE